ncbi:FAD-binding protein [Microdochium nivale]|nr:FAD-binding protein [Microdochium nivale]
MVSLRSIAAAALVGAASLVAADFGVESLPKLCRNFPGDPWWPSKLEWDIFNMTVNGNLIKTVPLGAPCHGATFDAAKCDFLKSQWQFEKVHFEDSSSVMAPFFANQSCDPFTPKEKPCELGNYVRYAVDATGARDIQWAVAFATLRNIRLVVRNTGHDYLGRSTGAGALGIWTHNLKDILFIPNYSSASYKGTAVKVGAGVQAFEAMAAARDRGQVIVGGECATVGLAGGYTQGGGHSALSTNFGLAADNVLNFEVVTATGQVVNANRETNSDLYWALAGGGGGTFGVVVSMTAKTYPDKTVGGATLQFFKASNNGNKTLHYAGIQAFHEELAGMVDAGAMVVHYFTTDFFMISPITAYGKTEAQVRAMLAPLEAKLNALGMVFASSYSESKDYYTHYDKYFGPLPLGNIQVGIAQYGARLIPRSVVTTIAPTWQAIIEKGVTWIGVGTNVKSHGTTSTSSVHPAWRDTLVHATLTLPWSFQAPWSDAFATQKKMTEEIMPLVVKATPGSGSYVNEADWRTPNWQESFWGSNYKRLLQIKQKWDPLSTFYVTVGVGSETWKVNNDGRMCTA